MANTISRITIKNRAILTEINASFPNPKTLKIPAITTNTIIQCNTIISFFLSLCYCATRARASYYSVFSNVSYVTFLFHPSKLRIPCFVASTTTEVVANPRAEPIPQKIGSPYRPTMPAPTALPI